MLFTTPNWSFKHVEQGCVLGVSLEGSEGKLMAKTVFHKYEDGGCYEGLLNL